MNNLAPGSQLAQVRPSGTTAETALTTANLRQEVTRVMIANSTGSPVIGKIYHDDDGGTFDASTLIYSKSIPANDTKEVEAQVQGGGITKGEAGTLGVESATGDALTFTFYGVSQRGR